MNQHQKIQNLKNKLGFEENDYELEAKKQVQQNKPRIILTDEVKREKPKEEDIEDIIDEIGHVGGYEVRRSGLSDEELNKIQEEANKNDIDIPKDKLEKQMAKLASKKHFFKINKGIPFTVSQIINVILGVIIIIGIVLFAKYK